MTAGTLAKGNEMAISSYCLRRVPPGLLHMRDAAWDHRLALAGWRSGKLNAANLMPLRYSGEKFNEELKVCAIQARMTAQWSDAVARWAESRVWWAARPADLVATWAAECQTVVL